MLDSLRGLAALAVCLHHFTQVSSPGIPDLFNDGDLIKTIGSFGRLGIVVFFVVSGFILPYTLYSKGYTLAQYPNWLVKRFTRLEPPYLLCIALILALNVLSTVSPLARGEPFVCEPKVLFAHFAYLNAFVGYEWFNPVFWTLAIEFQFYLALGVLFPLLVHWNVTVRIVSLLSLAGLSLVIQDERLLPHWFVIFALGIVTFQHRCRLLSTFQSLPLMLLLTLVSWKSIAWVPAVCAAGTVGVIVFADCLAKSAIWRPLQAVGLISYSLYLLHIPIGRRVVIVFQRFFPSDDLGKYYVLALAFAISLLSAWLFFRLIEKPSQSLAARFS
jgi:peptidoglycan/LPS O-acetylase OafA/YrhL